MTQPGVELRPGGEGLGVFAACRDGRRGARAAEARAAVPLHHPPGNTRATFVIYRPGVGALLAQDTVPQRHDPCNVRVAGFHRVPRSPGTRTAGESDSLSRRICHHLVLYTTLSSDLLADQ